MSSSLERVLERFYVKLPTSGSKKSKTVGAEVPESYDRWLSEIAASSEYPEYKTKSDIIRDGIHLVLTLRTDPQFRNIPELQHARKGILALQSLDHVNNMRATVEQLATSLYLAHPGTKEGQTILSQSEEFLAGLEDPDMQRRLSESIRSFKTRQ